MTVGAILIKLSQPEYKWIWELARVVVPAILIITGWKFVSWDQNRRETRKERRQLLDRTIELIDSIGNDAITMYVTTDDAESAKISVNMPPRLKRLEALLQVLNLRKSDKTAVVGSPLREAITMTNLYRADPRVAVAADDVRLSDIYVETSALIQELERSYRDTYQ